MQIEPLISVQLLEPPIVYLTQNRVDPVPILKKFSLDQIVVSDRTEIITLRKFVAFLEEASRQLSDPHFGLHAGLEMYEEILGPINYLIDGSDTLRDALNGLSNYIMAIQEGTQNKVSTTGEIARFEYQIDDETIAPRVQDAELSISATYAKIKSYLEQKFSPIEVWFEHSSQTSLKAYQAKFGCPVHFEQETNAMIFSAVDLERGRSKLSAGLAEIVRDHISNLIHTKDNIYTFSDQISTILSPTMLEEGISLATIANKMGVSEQTLARKLRSDGTTFHNIVQSKKINIAKRLLKHSELPIGQIAFRVGYSENASFSRAFKANTGISPEQFRKKATKSGERTLL